VYQFQRVLKETLAASTEDRLLQKSRSKLQILNSKEEAILAAVRELHYVTALDITYMFFSPTSLTHVREVLSRMAGNGDYVDRQFLYRFPLPSTAQGTKTRVYSLGARGREILAEKPYPRPYKLRNLSYSHIFHHLTLNCHNIVGVRAAITS
jgi:hypothetical protein